MKHSDCYSRPCSLIKIGGKILDNPDLLEELATGIKLVEGNFVILVHGGSKDIKLELDRLGKEFVFVDGLRVTDGETIRVVEMVLSGLVNKRIVRALTGAGIRALGLSGCDMGLIRAEPLELAGVDLGLVGRVNRINTEPLGICARENIVPVISPVGIGETGEPFNINADHAASAIAREIKADDLVYFSDVPGVMIDGRRQATLTSSQARRYIDQGKITGGMIPKIQSAIEALEQGVGQVHLAPWTGPESIANELAGDTAGTIVKPDP